MNYLARSLTAGARSDPFDKPRVFPLAKIKAIGEAGTARAGEARSLRDRAAYERTTINYFFCGFFLFRCLIFDALVQASYHVTLLINVLNISL